MPGWFHVHPRLPSPSIWLRREPWIFRNAEPVYDDVRARQVESGGGIEVVRPLGDVADDGSGYAGLLRIATESQASPDALEVFSDKSDGRPGL